MTKSHGRKSRARKTSRRQGAGFAAANAGTLHVHGSGPSSAELMPADPGRWGAECAPDLQAAAALIGACIEECVSCRRSLSGKLLEAESIVLAVTAGAVFALHASRGVDAQDFGAQPAEVFFRLVDRARAAGDDLRVLPAAVERMPLTDREPLLDEALDLWASYGRQYPDLIRGENLARALRWSHTPVPAMNGRSGPTPNRSEPRQPSKESQFPMSARTEDITENAESAARTIAELVAGLQRDGIAPPVQAQRLDALLTRSATELKAVLTLLRACVGEFQEQGLLMTDYRGEPLDRVLQRYTEAAPQQKTSPKNSARPPTPRSRTRRPAGGRTHPTSWPCSQPTSSSKGSNTRWRPTASTATSPAARAR